MCSIEDEFYSQNCEELQNKKIIILGSSYTGALNNDYINNYFTKNKLNFTSYNLSIGVDTPSNRIWSVNNLISMNLH